MSTAEIRRVAFARAGRLARLFDPGMSRRDAAPGEIKQRL